MLEVNGALAPGHTTARKKQMREKIERLLALSERVVAQYKRQEEASLKERTEAADVLGTTVEMAKELFPVISRPIVRSEEAHITALKDDAVRKHHPEKGVLVLGKGPKDEIDRMLKRVFVGTDLFITESGKFLLVEYSGSTEAMMNKWTSTAKHLTAVQVVDTFKVKSVERIVDTLLKVVDGHDGGRDKGTRETERNRVLLNHVGGLLGLLLRAKFM